VLLDLQTLDIVPGECQRHNKGDRQNSHAHLNIHPTANRVSCKHESASGRDQAEENDKVAIDAVEQNEGAADYGYKLQAGEQCRRKNASKVYENSCPVNGAFGVVIAVERRFGALRLTASVKREVLQPCEGETSHGASKDEEQDEVVAFGKSDWVVHFARDGDESVCRGPHSHLGTFCQSKDTGGFCWVKYGTS
jgi:hypothetical protein